MRFAVALFVLVFLALGLLLGLAAASGVETIKPMEQALLFEQCISQAKSDGELAEQEYFACAYGIYS